MYGSGITAASVGTAGAGALAYTGFESIWYVVGGITLIAAGFALNKIVPRRQS